MKIIVAHNLYPPFARGGAEKFTQELVASLLALGHEVLIVTTRPRTKRVADQASIKYLPSLYYHLAEVPKALRLIWHWHNVRSRRTEKVLLALPFVQSADLIITNNLQGLGLSFASALQARGVRWVHVIHDLQLLHPSGLVNYGQEFILAKRASASYQRLVKQYLGQPDLVISPSQWIMDWHRQYGFFNQSLATVLPNPSPQQTVLTRQPSADCHFVYLGQVEDHKGLILLLDAFAKFSATAQTKAHLTVAGEGRLLNLLKLNYQNLPVNFVGRLESQAVSSLLAQATCLVVPSLCYENWPTVIIEASLAGLPVIASNLGGNQELIHNHDYLFVPKLDSLVAKLKWVETNRQLLKPPVLPSLLSGKHYAERLLDLITK